MSEIRVRDDKYPTVARGWRDRWDDIVPFLAYPAEMRRVIYTTNAIEALNRNLRKALKTRGQMPSDEAALKLLYLSVRHDPKTSTRSVRDWTTAMHQFAIYFHDRLPASSTPGSGPVHRKPDTPHQTRRRHPRVRRQPDDDSNPS